MRRTAILGRAVLWGALGALVAGAAVALATPVGLGSLQAVVPVSVVVFATLTGVKYTKDTIMASMGRGRASTERHLANVERRLGQRLGDLETAIPQASAAAATFGDLAFPLPLGAPYALAWDVAGVLTREVVIGRPTTVVELGSGGSSLLIGECLRRLGGGHLYTLDHEPSYAAKTRRQLDGLGLGDWVTVLDAPLVEQDVGGVPYRWYDLPDVVRGLTSIDLLIVDGPPQTVDPAGMPRYPAFPLLVDQLSASALVFVDDQARPGEQRMIERWLTEEPGWAVEVEATSRGTGLLRRSGAR